jgi:hypothetical protein
MAILAESADEPLAWYDLSYYALFAAHTAAPRHRLARPRYSSGLRRSRRPQSGLDAHDLITTAAILIIAAARRQFRRSSR